jgi:NAD-dependent deacetylase
MPGEERAQPVWYSWKVSVSGLQEGGGPPRDVPDPEAARLADMLREAIFAVALTGAGVSTASGIPDFRSPGTGLWSRYDPQKVASLSAFRRDPESFWGWYAQRFLSLGEVGANPAHEALAALESGGWLRGLITQNIDQLHRKAGSRRLVEVHGSIAHADCLSCGRRYPRARVLELLSAEGLPRCRCGAVLKPGVVLFEEDLPEAPFKQAVEWATQSDLFLVAGSSLEVWPVAGLPELAVDTGARLVIVNGSETPMDDLAALVFRRPVEVFLPQVARLLSASG